MFSSSSSIAIDMSGVLETLYESNPPRDRTAVNAESSTRPVRSPINCRDYDSAMHKYGVFAPTAGDLIVALVSSLTPSRQLQTPLLRSPKKLSDGSDKENSTPRPRWLRGAAAPQAR